MIVWCTMHLHHKNNYHNSLSQFLWVCCYECCEIEHLFEVMRQVLLLVWYSEQLVMIMRSRWLLLTKNHRWVLVVEQWKCQVEQDQGWQNQWHKNVWDYCWLSHSQDCIMILVYGMYAYWSLDSRCSTTEPAPVLERDNWSIDQWQNDLSTLDEVCIDHIR